MEAGSSREERTELGTASLVLKAGDDLGHAGTECAWGDRHEAEEAAVALHLGQNGRGSVAILSDHGDCSSEFSCAGGIVTARATGNKEAANVILKKTTNGLDLGGHVSRLGAKKKGIASSVALASSLKPCTVAVSLGGEAAALKEGVGLRHKSGHGNSHYGEEVKKLHFLD